MFSAEKKRFFVYIIYKYKFIWILKLSHNQERVVHIHMITWHSCNHILKTTTTKSKKLVQTCKNHNLALVILLKGFIDLKPHWKFMQCSYILLHIY